MVDAIPYVVIGFSVGALFMTFIYNKVIDRMIIKHYDAQKVLINKFYTEMQEQSDKFFSIMKTYLQKEGNND